METDEKKNHCKKSNQRYMSKNRKNSVKKNKQNKKKKTERVKEKKTEKSKTDVVSIRGKNDLNQQKIWKQV